MPKPARKIDDARETEIPAAVLNGRDFFCRVALDFVQRFSVCFGMTPLNVVESGVDSTVMSPP